MARIIEYYPDPMMVEICSSCKEKIKVKTMFDCDDTPYPACEFCGDVIENIWSGWKPKEKDCPLCIQYAQYFDREYGDAYSAYHKNHTCICGHLHKSDKPNCENIQCGCCKFISYDGVPVKPETVD